MILDYNRKPDATVDEKIQSLMENTQLALNDIIRAQQTADVAKEDAQTSVALSQTARQAANEASESAARAKEAADEATEAVEEIEGDVSSLTTRVAQAESDIDTAEGNITSLTGRVADAEGDITTIEGNVSSLAGRVADAEADISTAEGNISTLQSDVATAQGNISTIQGNITNLSGRVSDAESDITTVEGNITTLTGRVSDAEEEVEDVMKGLALAEDVVGTLNWITAHSTVTTDTVPDPDTIYYIKHLDGTFEVVTDTTGKNPAQEGWYVLDEALQNYVLSHLSLQNDGLYVMKDGSHWKVKITDNGVYILDPNNDPANQMTGSGNIIGYDDETHAEIDYHSLKLIGRNETTPYFWVSDLRDKNDNYQATIVESFDGRWLKTFDATLTVSGAISAVDESDPTNEATWNGNQVTFERAVPSGTLVSIAYKTTDERAKAYTVGKRVTNTPIGPMSYSEGNGSISSAYCSHAEGRAMAKGALSHAEANGNALGYSSHAEGSGTASGYYSHAEGEYTEASGHQSHAGGSYTIAGYSDQTAIGKYNDNQSDTAFEIGNGTDNNNRSNAFTVDWDGNVEASGDFVDGQGNVLSAKADASSVPTATSQLSNDSGFITQETDPTVPSWAKASTKPTYTASEISGLVDFLRPVGTTYSTVDPNFNPNTVWGGTWEKLPEGYVLLSGSDSGSYKVGDDAGTASGYKEYGENTHKLTENEMPSHRHLMYYANYNRGTGSNATMGYLSQSSQPNSSYTQYTGGGQAHNIMQKSIAVYWWIRTA